MKRVLLALLCIAIAVCGFLSAFDLLVPIESAVGELSVLSIVCGLGSLCLAIYYFYKRNLLIGTLMLAALFASFEENVAYVCGQPDGNMINNWLLFGLALAMGFGLSLLLPKRQWRIFGKNVGVHSDGDGQTTSQSFCSNTVYIDCSSFTNRGVENNMGSLVVRFENSERFAGGTLTVENNMGSLVICVPIEWNVDCDIENNLGSIQNQRAACNGSACLYIKGENNMGSIVIKDV